MFIQSWWGRLWQVAGLSLVPSCVLAQLTLTTFTPPANASHVARTAPLEAAFSLPLGTSASDGLRVFSTQRGGLRTGHSGTSLVSGALLRFTPTYPWQPGEVVQATLTSAVRSSSGLALGTGRVSQFTAAVTGGSGQFVLGSDVAAQTTTESITTADVDGDGDLDLLTAQYHGNRVNVQLNTGNGSFVYGSDVLVGTMIQASPFSVTTADLDSDGDLDLLTANNWPAGTASVRFNDGTGHFGGGSEVDLGANPVWITTADVDADGDLDLLAANSGSSNVSVRLNDGTGQFKTAPFVAVGPAPQCVVAGDVDGDGDLDLLTANYGVYMGPVGTTVSVRLNDGTGRFSGSQEISVGPHPFAVAVGDVDKDGDLDVLSVSSDAVGIVSVRLNNGTGQFAGGSDVSVGANPRTVALGDVDGDGDLDMLTANYNFGGNGSVSVRLNDGRGQFLLGSEVATADGPWSVATADLDQDGDLDLLAGTFPGMVSVRLNQNRAPVPNVFIRGDSLLCNGGQLQLTARSSGSITAYQWSTGATTPSISVTQPGLYTVTTTFSTGQTNTAQFRVRTFTPTVHIEGDSLLCAGTALPLTAVAPGATAMRWSTGDTTATIRVTKPGLYQVTVLYGSGCRATAQRQVGAPQLQLMGVPVVCAGGSTQLIAMAPGATAFKWDTGPTTATLEVTRPGTYRVVATFATGCTLTATQSVSAPSVQLLGDSLLCLGQASRLTAMAPGAIAYQWNTGATTPTIAVTQPGTYTVTATYGSGCTATAHQQVRALPTVATLSLGADTTVCEGEAVRLRVQGLGTIAAHYHWADGSTAPTLSVHQPGTYELQVQLPCATQILTRRVAFELCLVIPNVITPNGDGLNDCFRINGLPAGPWALTLYNRWGQQVYQTATYQQDWGAQASPGIYYYHLRRAATGTSYKGWVEVVP
jgi:gliding motility-associated-like protein